jgi:hypothetical protein
VNEFDRQVDRLLSCGVAEAAEPGGQAASREGLQRSLEALRTVCGDAQQTDSAVAGQSFVLIPAPSWVDVEALVPLMTLAGGSRPGVLDRNHGSEGLSPYSALPDLGVPPDDPYLLVDVERGEEFCDVRPRDAVAEIVDRGRTPLTILEGIMLQLVRPDLLVKNRCFMLAGSRRGDRRVPALWISGGAPKLGWCWEGNPHSWLGTASAAERRVARPPVD